MTIPWFRPADRHNYAKFVPIYVAEIKVLESQHPESYQHMAQGGFVVPHPKGHIVNCVATDTPLEQTINREGKQRLHHKLYTLLRCTYKMAKDTSHNNPSQNSPLFGYYEKPASEPER